MELADALAKRSALMAEGFPVPAYIDGDVPTLPTKGEVEWATNIHHRIADIEWCMQLRQFTESRCSIQKTALIRPQ